MSSDYSIRCDGLGKAFQLYAHQNDQLKQVLFGAWKQFYTEKWVLNDVNFKVRKGERVGIVGRNGAGKTTMCLQLANAITASGNVCLFNTAEESLFQVRKVAKRLGMQDGFVAGQDSLVADILEHADHLRKANKGKQVFLIIDSLQTLDDGKYKDGFTNSMSQVRATEMITNWCKENFGVAIIIGQVTKGGEFAGKQQIKHTVDAHAHLFIDDKKNSETFGERLFEVQKNRFGCSGKTFILGIEKKGLYEKGTISYND